MGDFLVAKLTVNGQEHELNKIELKGSLEDIITGIRQVQKSSDEFLNKLQKNGNNFERVITN